MRYLVLTLALAAVRCMTYVIDPQEAMKNRRAIEFVTVVEVVTDVVWVEGNSSAITISSNTQAATSAVSTPQSTAIAQIAPVSALGAFEQACITRHNDLRSRHKAGPLAWSNDLAASAQALAKTCKFGHDQDLGPAKGYGQNIGASWGTLESRNSTTEALAVIEDGWYTQESQTFAKLNLYGVANPVSNNFAAWGHFTQEVWVKTTHVGCAVAACPQTQDSAYISDGYYTVCNYDPAGNVIGNFAENVFN